MTLLQNPSWEINLEGNSWALEQLFLATSSREDWCISIQKGEWRLQFPLAENSAGIRLESLNENPKEFLATLQAEKDQAKTTAQHILRNLNSILFLTDSSVKPLEFGHMYYADNGKRLAFVDIVESFSISDHISATSFDREGNILEQIPADRIRGLLQLSEQSPDTFEMLQYMQEYGMNDWVGLYKIFEQLSAKLGGEHRLISILDTTKAEKNRFTNTANNPAASGLMARHAVQDTQPPANPMSVEEGREYIKTLLFRYFALNIPKENSNVP